MTQTIALFIDAYRELNSRKLFWITLILSAVVIAAFGLLGVKGDTLSFLRLHWEFPGAATLYKSIFSTVVIGLWMTWVANVLALVSTAGIYPDLIASGTVDLYIARPISRLRLFLTKYATGLLFVSLQVLVFATGSFVVLGLRGGLWRPSLFLSVPVVVCLFSYLFGACVFVGVWTRSTIVALLAAMLLWLASSLVQRAEEQFLLPLRLGFEKRAQSDEKELHQLDADIQRLETNKSEDLMGLHAGLLRKRRDAVVRALPEARKDASQWRTTDQIAAAIKNVLPKTVDTTNLLDRWLFTDEELGGREDGRGEHMTPFGLTQRELAEAGGRAQQTQRAQPIAWVLGTSLAFEAAMVGLAAWIFCRRDY